MASMQAVPRRWSARTVILAVIVLFHAGLFYFLATQRARTGSGDDRQAFTPIERETRGSSGSLAAGRPKKSLGDGGARENLSGGGAKGSAAAQSVTLWRFEPFEIWPAAAKGQTPEANPALEGIRAQPHEADGAQIESSGNDVAIRSGAWPQYPAEWARAGEEGVVALELRIDQQDKATEVTVRSSSASSRLESAAKQAISTWTFARPAWVPVGVRVELEMRFNAYRYQLSRITGPLPDGESKTNVAEVKSEEALRNLIAQLSSSKPTFANLENTQADFQKMRTTVVKWGPARSVRLLNPNESSWKEYIANREFRSNSHGGTIALRWDLYDVRHENTRAQWKIATDPYGRIWAAKADTHSTEP